MFPNDDDLKASFTYETDASPISDTSPFHILILGSWSGAGSQIDLSERCPVVIDRDNFDEVLRRLNVRLELDFYFDGNDVLSLQFSELDDFHPDNLFRNISLFSELRDIRRRLSNSDTFDKAAKEFRSRFPTVDENITADVGSRLLTNDISQIESSDLLDLIISQPEELSISKKPQTVDKTPLGRLLSEIIHPHLIKIDENEQSKLITAVDETISELMRRVLHHSHFQSLESAWRGLYFLVKRIETDVDLKIFILDVSQNELSNNLKSSDDLAESFFYRRVIADVNDNSNEVSWALIAGNYSFGLNVDDVAALMRIGKIASLANAPFISHIRPEMFGIKSFTSDCDYSKMKFSEETSQGKLWNALRNIPESGYLGLSPMRFLIRLPYGQTSDVIESFSFEEFTSLTEQECFLWANPCFIFSLLLGQSFRLYSWEMGKELCRDVEKLPVCIYLENGETKIMSSVEAFIPDNFAENLLQQGLMPLISFRESDWIRLLRFQSISSSVLKGKWV